MSYLTATTREDRVIALIDMDCFYAQVEQRERPELWGKPVAVAQYVQWKGGGLIAVSYEARAAGVKRGSMRGDDAKAICPELTVCYVPMSAYGEKADLTKYRDASAEVFKVLNDFDSRIVVERASIDEAYLDLTTMVDHIMSNSRAEPIDLTLDRFPTTHIADGKDTDEGYIREDSLKSWLDRRCSEDLASMRMALGAEIVERIRARIKYETQFHCSAGVGANKVIAKLVCARHKPRQQTIIAPEFASVILETTPLRSVRNLGGKLGKQLIEGFNIQTMGELAAIPKDALLEKLGPKVTNWLLLLAKGIDHEEVKARDVQLSIGASRNFPGKTALTTVAEVTKWLHQLINELSDRLTADRAKNGRTARSLSVGYIGATGSTTQVWLLPSTTRHCTISSCAADVLYRDAWAVLRLLNKSNIDGAWEPPMLNLSLSASKFTDGVESASKSITQFMTARAGTSKQAEADDDSIERDDDDDDTDNDLSRSPLKRKLDHPREQQTTTPDAKRTLMANAVEEEEQSVVELIDDDDQTAAASSGGSSALPTSFGDISAEVLNSLPPEIRLELTQYYRQKERPSASTAPAKQPQSKSKPPTKRGPNKKAVAKKATPTKKKSPPKKQQASEKPSAMFKISDYFTQKP